jgi:hypothetical protein
MSLVIVRAALPDFVVSAWLVAVTVTFAGDGKSLGAEYRPPVLIVPTLAFPPATELTLQLTLALEDPVTFAVNCSEFPSSTLPLGAETETVTVCGGGAVPPPLPPVQPEIPLMIPISKVSTLITLHRSFMKRYFIEISFPSLDEGD